jgi:hypothetical protein
LPSSSTQQQEAVVTADSAEKLLGYVGRFTHAPQAWDVKIKDSKLWVATEGKEFAMTKIGEDEYSYEQGQIRFVKDKQGKYSHIFMGLYAARRAD